MTPVELASLAFVLTALGAVWLYKQLDELSREIESLRTLCSSAYQVVGAANGPIKMLDNLSAAANGDSLPHDPLSGIPWAPNESEVLRDKQLQTFVAGAKWWQYTANGATAFLSEIDLMEAKVARRYMTPHSAKQ